MSQSDNKKTTPPRSEQSTSPAKEVKLEGSLKAETEKPKSFVLPPEDDRLKYRVVANYRRLTLFEKVIRFLSRLFGK